MNLLKRILSKPKYFSPYIAVARIGGGIFSSILENKLINLNTDEKTLKDTIIGCKSSDSIKIIEELHKYNKLNIPFELYKDIDVSRIYKIIDVNYLCSEELLNTIIHKPSSLFEIIDYLSELQKKIPLETIILIGKTYINSNPIIIDRLLSMYSLSTFNEEGKLFYINFYSKYNKSDRVIPFISLLNPFKTEYYNPVYSLLRIENNLIVGYELYNQIKNDKYVIKNASVGIINCLYDLRKNDELSEFTNRCIENYHELNTEARIHLFKSVNLVPNTINELIKKSTSDEIFYLMNFYYRKRRDLIKEIDKSNSSYISDYYFYLNQKDTMLRTDSVNSNIINNLIENTIEKITISSDSEIKLIPNLVLDLFNKYNEKELFNESLQLSIFYSKLKHNDADVVISMIMYYHSKSDDISADHLLNNYENNHDPIDYKYSLIYEMRKNKLDKIIKYIKEII